MLKAAAFTLFILTTLVPIPDGWKLPGVEYASEEWRLGSGAHFTEVSGNFNGDGLADYAEILVSGDARCFKVFAFIARDENGGYEVHALIPTEDIKYLTFTGIDKVEPGSYLTACGKGYWECSADEPPELSIL
jgi:hypothetical protein